MSVYDLELISHCSGVSINDFEQVNVCQGMCSGLCLGDLQLFQPSVGFYIKVGLSRLRKFLPN